MSSDGASKAGVGVSLIVRKKKSLVVNLLILCMFAVWAAITVIVWKLAGYMGLFMGGFLLVPLVILLNFIRVKYIKVEYEYVFSSGILEITKIENQENRVSVVRVPVDDIIKFGRVADADAPQVRKESTKTFFCGISDENEVSYYFTCDVENNGVKMYVFDPDDRVLNALRRYSPMIEKATKR